MFGVSFGLWNLLVVKYILIFLFIDSFDEVKNYVFWSIYERVCR